MSDDRFDQDINLAATQQAGRQHAIADPKADGSIFSIAQHRLGQFDHCILDTASRYRPFEGAVIYLQSQPSVSTRN